jgi:hypothetical protein
MGEQYGLVAQMGLLDDAIREHLELKRLNGADPGVVAREEQDALGPVHREDEALNDGQVNSGTSRQEAGESTAGEVEQVHGAGSSGTSQETVEINMDAELAQGHPEPTPDSPRTAPVADPRAKGEESFEWEMPREGIAAEDATNAEVDNDVDDQIEDVLEETPDFLRDTPEQERLWFEQRPPRDFDFNE